MKALRAVLAGLMVVMSLSVGVGPAMAASTYHPVDRWPSPTWHLDNPSGVALDTAGNTYVADTDNNCVRKYGPDRVLIAVWGSLGTGDGQFRKPMDVAVDESGYVYVADAGNHRIQKLTTSGAFVARWGSQGGPDLSGSADGEFNDPRGISVDGAGNVYVADTGNDRVQKFAPTGTFLSKWGYPGNTPGQFYSPTGIAVETSGTVFVADNVNRRVQEFGPDGQFVDAWSVPAPPAPAPVGIAVDNNGHVYVSGASFFAARIQKYTRKGVLVLEIGAAGSGDGMLNRPVGLACDVEGNVWVADSHNDRIQWFASNGTLGEVLGSWGVSAGRFRSPSGVAVGPSGDVYVADTVNHRIQRLSENGAVLGVRPLSASPVPGSQNGQFSNPVAIAVDPAGNVFVADRDNNRIQKLTREIGVDGDHLVTWGTLGSGDGYFNKPGGIAVDGAGNVYVADTLNNRVQKFDNDGRFIKWWGGLGTTTGKFTAPEGIAADAAGNIYVADTGNKRVQRFSSDGTFLTAWGSQGQGESQFMSPAGIAVASDGSRVFVTDRELNRVQAFTAAGVFHTQFGTRGPEEGQLQKPVGVAVSPDGYVYVADRDNHRIQKFVEHDAVRVIIEGVEDGGAYKRAVTPEVTFTSGELVASIIKLNDEIWAPAELSAEGRYVLYAWAKGIYDFEDSKTVSFVIDMTPPQVSDNALESYEGAASIVLSATDALSGVASVSYSIDGGAVVTSVGEEATVRVSEPGFYDLAYYATDRAGNVSNTSSVAFEVIESDTDAEPVIAIEGVSRYDTAVAASLAAYPDGLDPAGARTVVIATGRNWPDALGGSALAGALDGPILLVPGMSVPDVVAAEITRLGAVKAIVVGGEVAVAPSVVSALQNAGLATERVWGPSRYETADAVASRTRELLGETFDGTAFVATGGAYADAVAAAPLAASQGWPLYLSHPSAGMRAETLAAMQGVSDVLVLGGTLAVSEDTHASLQSEFDTVERLAGTTRYGTAARVASHGVATTDLVWDRVGIATGQAYPDALAGGVLQGKVGSVMLLTRTASLPDETVEALSVNTGVIGTVTYFGGELAVSAAVRAEVAQLLQ